MRLGWLTLAAVATAVLGFAFVLSPDPAGHGTHTQLGLPPCGFLVATGLPCPGCGLTTSFAYMARLDLVRALDAHPVGAVLFVLAVAAVPITLLGAVRGWPFAVAFDRFRAYPISLVIAGLLALHWLVEVLWVGPAAMFTSG